MHCRHYQNYSSSYELWCSNVNLTDVYARGVNVNLTPLTSKRGALATDARGCSLWRSLLERLPHAWESWVRDPLGTIYELGRCGPGRGCYINKCQIPYSTVCYCHICNRIAVYLKFIYTMFMLTSSLCKLPHKHLSIKAVVITNH